MLAFFADVIVPWHLGLSLILRVWQSGLVRFRNSFIDWRSKNRDPSWRQLKIQEYSNFTRKTKCNLVRKIETKFHVDWKWHRNYFIIRFTTQSKSNANNSKVFKFNCKLNILLTSIKHIEAMQNHYRHFKISLQPSEIGKYI